MRWLKTWHGCVVMWCAESVKGWRLCKRRGGKWCLHWLWDGVSHKLVLLLSWREKGCAKAAVAHGGCIGCGRVCPASWCCCGVGETAGTKGTAACVLYMWWRTHQLCKQISCWHRGLYGRSQGRTSNSTCQTSMWSLLQIETI